MKRKSLYIALGIISVVIILLIGIVSWGIGIRNEIVTLDESVLQNWSQVENQYQRRADLIPNLVSTVKGVANFEKETYTAVTEARSKVGQMNLTPELLNNPASFQKFQAAQDNLSGALSRLLVSVENYPQLKANENFQKLQDQLEGTENRITVERMNFNKTVQKYNTTIRKFPASLIAGFSNFKEKPYFKAAEGTSEVPKVEF